jgi:hypothetical protein
MKFRQATLTALTKEAFVLELPTDEGIPIEIARGIADDIMSDSSDSDSDSESDE